MMRGVSPPVAPYRIHSRRAWTLAALAALVACAVYVGTLDVPFVHDDAVQITQNRALRSWASLPRALVADVWASTPSTPLLNYWRPVLVLWLFLNYAIFANAPAGWHAATILAHALATLLLYFLALRLVRDLRVATTAAVLFAVHPVSIESVAWVGGVADPLLAAFTFGALIFLHRHLEDGRAASLTASCLLFAGALLSKETAAALVIVVLVFAWAMSRSVKSAALISLPFFALTGLFMLTRAVVLSGASAGAKPNSLLHAALTWPALLAFYVRLLLIPAEISPYYDLRVVRSAASFGLLLPLLLLVFVIMALWLWGSREPARSAWVLAVALLFAPLLPVLYLAIRVNDFAHARYAYLPSAGFALLMALALTHVARLSLRTALGTVLVIALAALNVTQQPYWSSDSTLYAHGLQIAPLNPVAVNKAGEQFESQGEFDRAIPLFHHALRLDADFSAAALNLGESYLAIGEFDSAVRWLSRTAELDPKSPRPYALLATAELQRGNGEAAEAAAREALRRDPRGRRLHFVRGLALEQLGRRSEAENEFRAELLIDPAYAPAIEALGRVAANGQNGQSPTK